VLLEHQHIEPIDKDTMAAAKIALRLFARERGGAERDAGFQHRLLHVLDRVEQDRRSVDDSGQVVVRRQLKRRWTSETPNVDKVFEIVTRHAPAGTLRRKAGSLVDDRELAYR
jgi:hypothetical protein